MPMHQTTANTAACMLSRKRGPFSGYILSGIGMRAFWTCMSLVAVIQQLDHVVVVGWLDKRQMRTLSEPPDFWIAFD